MRQRYVVQVVDDSNQDVNQEQSISNPPAQPEASAQAEVDLAPPISNREGGAERAFVTEVVDSNPPTDLKQQKQSFPTESSQSTKKQIPAENKPAKESTKAPEPSSPVYTPHSSPPVTAGTDYWQQRQQQINKLWRQEELKKAASEQLAVKNPKKTVDQPSFKQEERFTDNKPKPASKIQKIESFYKRQTEPVNLEENFETGAWQKIQSVWNKHRRLAALLLAVLVVGLSSWFVWMGVKFEINSTSQQAELLVQDLEESRFTSATERLQILEAKHEQYQTWYHWARPVVRVVQGREKTEHLDRLFTVSEQGMEVVDSGLGLYQDIDQAYQQFVGESAGESIETFTQVNGDLEALFTRLSALQAELNNLGNPYDIKLLTKVKKELGQELPDLRRHVLAAQKITQVLPEILGNEESKTYLVLLQNNAELRPTGGFIGSFALVTVQNGALQDFKVEDVYEADGQLNGFVTPPEEIVQYLDEEQWFLRDVNWSPDFPEVAQRASWFLDKSLQVQPDGVVGINLDVVKKFLEVTGPLELADYDEVVTADSLYEQAELHSELNFFPGSNQKKDYLSAVASRLLDKLFYQPSNKIKLARVVLDSAEQSELLISVENKQVEEVLADLGWNGDVRTPTCPPPLAGSSPDNCFVDTALQVEANVGVNKANQYIKRSIKHEVELTADRARHTRTITLQNTALSQAWPAGDYKTYLRLYVTKGSELRSAFLDNQPLDLTQFKVEQDAGKQVFGYYLTVPIKSTHKLEIFYETPLKVDGQMAAYALFEQKQPGTSGDEVTQIIDTREFDVTAVAPEPEFINDKLQFTSDRTTHNFVGVKLK